MTPSGSVARLRDACIDRPTDPGATLARVHAAHGNAAVTRIPPHDELTLIRLVAQSLASERDTEGQAGFAVLLGRTVEKLASILDLHGEFGAADEARAILAAVDGRGASRS